MPDKNTYLLLSNLDFVSDGKTVREVLARGTLKQVVAHQMRLKSAGGEIVKIIPDFKVIESYE